MLKIGVTIRSVLPHLPAAIRAEVPRIIDTALRTGQGVAMAESPVRTGFLRSSIGVEMRTYSGTLYARANYAGFVNYGTRRMSARPFMTHGADAARESMAADVRAIESRLPRV